MKHTYLFAGILTLGTGTSAMADIVQADDVIISKGTQSTMLCVGRNCVDGETFSTTFDAFLRLKANNNVIEFDDTSTISGAPNRDWAIRANETTGGTAGEAFFIRDTTASTNPFYIEGDAPSNSLFIEGSSGQVGMGTTAPESDLHLLSNDSSKMTIELPGSSKWETGIGGFGYVLADVLSGRTEVLLIENGAAPNSLVMLDSGRIGLGTLSPNAGLHLRRSNGEGAMLIEETTAGTLGQLTLRNNGTTFFTLEDTSIWDGPNSGRKWNFQNQAGTFRVTTAPGGPGEIEMILTQDGDMTIEGELTTSGGTCGGGCDAVFTEDYDLPSIQQHADAMWSLGHLPNVGPTLENQPINVSDKVGRMLNELEHAHIYIDQLHTQLAEHDAEKVAMAAQIDAQADRLDALERTLLSLTAD
ncbi:MAG: hypothetical protein AB8B82_01245 [Roseovarius sp.]